ncbi:hypothetical protein [Aurantimonas sp. VKM B-3413]|uniref:pyroglutamyl-peptidase I family protein n=1 Tax=Aurantimonas sp. VKM B-3413 TaxID=2779401 RepID=UPI001E58147A|nr:hypothetical protein [Aurantimonas sp. VKM B-3413]MCB8836920.1 hypothetical protein [Aurantimonas sp. VKM B-3413]
MPILVAGFSAFPGIPASPSGDLARSLGAGGETVAAASEADAAPVHAVVLPVEWGRSWPVLRTAIEAVRPQTVLLFGLHLRSERFRVEMQARNFRELGRGDAVESFPAGPSILDGPATLPLRLPWTRVAEALRGAGIAFEWSTHAGGYVVNDTLYRLAFAATALGVERYGLFHLPMSDERVEECAQAGGLPEVFLSLPFADIERAASALVATIRDLEGGHETR